MSHLPLDARAILHYLNELGYRNISAIQLKEFLKDLRKLIKYEERLGINNHQNDYYESLFRRTTASYRAKVDRENDKEDVAKRSRNSSGPSCSKQATAKNRKVLTERNNGEISSSNDLLSSDRSSNTLVRKTAESSNIDKTYIKALIEKKLTHILHDKYSQEFVDKDKEKLSQEAAPIKSMIEQILKEKLNDLHHRGKHKENLNLSKPGSLRSIIEHIVTEVLQEKFSNVQKQGKTTKSYTDALGNLSQDFQQKVTISNNQDVLMHREHQNHYQNNIPLDSQSLVAQLLSPENEVQNKNIEKKLKADKNDNSKAITKASNIKRLHRSPTKKPEWQDPCLHDILNKPVKKIRSQSPAVSSSARSGRSSSVLIRRSKSHGRKPASDPVALYQYYKNEWEHFRNQIPGESSHDRLRWHVRQRLLDPK